MNRTTHPAVALWRRRWALNARLHRYQRPKQMITTKSRNTLRSTAPVALLRRA